jgi:hypothetical protein
MRLAPNNIKLVIFTFIYTVSIYAAPHNGGPPPPADDGPPTPPGFPIDDYLIYLAIIIITYSFYLYKKKYLTTKKE